MDARGAAWVPKDTLRSADGEDLSRAFTVQELLDALRALKPHKNEGKAVDGDDAAVDHVVPVADDVLGHVAAERARLQRQSALLRSSGLNWMVGVGRYLQSVWRERTERGPPLSQRRHRGMAELDAFFLFLRNTRSG